MEPEGYSERLAALFSKYEMQVGNARVSNYHWTDDALKEPEDELATVRAILNAPLCPEQAARDAEFAANKARAQRFRELLVGCIRVAVCIQLGKIYSDVRMDEMLVVYDVAADKVIGHVAFRGKVFNYDIRDSVSLSTAQILKFHRPVDESSVRRLGEEISTAVCKQLKESGLI